MKQLLLDELEIRWKKYRSRLKRCRADFSVDAVHDLRVATRRMLAVIQLLYAAHKQERLKKLKQTFKARLDAFDEIRDAQVMLGALKKIINKLPQLEGFQSYLKVREAELLHTLREQVDGVDTGDIRELLQQTRDAIEKKSEEEFSPRIYPALDASFAIAQQRTGWVDVANPGTIHRVRIAFKSFRYMLEIVQPTVKGLTKEHMKRMNKYQSLMGEIQDASVLTKAIADYSEHTQIPDIEPVIRYCEKRHAKAIAAYVRVSGELNTFWRTEPTAPLS